MKCIIVEDELPAQMILKNYISKFSQLELIETFQTAITAHDFLKSNSVDLIFLDINLPDISGLDFFKTLNNPPKVIITTAYPNYALDSFELDTIVDYLVKPFPIARFLKAISKAEKFHITSNKTAEFIYLNIDKALHKVNLNNLLYIESDRNYLTFVTTKRRLIIIDALKKWSTKLVEKKFMQVHKSYIVNLDKIDKISGNELKIDNYKIPIGRTYKKKIMANL